MDIEAKIKTIMSEILDIAVEDIDENATPDTVEDWDSLNHMNLVLALEEEFGILFDDDEILELLNPRVICAKVEEKLEM